METKSVSDFGRNLLEAMEDVRFFLILAGWVDVLEIVQSFNVVSVYGAAQGHF